MFKVSLFKVVSGHDARNSIVSAQSLAPPRALECHTLFWKPVVIVLLYFRRFATIAHNPAPTQWRRYAAL